jgi:hypothetical protein
MDKTYGDTWDRRVAAFLMRFPEYIVTSPGTSASRNFATPRAWTALALLLPSTPAEFTDERIFACVGVEVGSKFAAFLRTKVPAVEEILENPEILRELSLDALYLAAVSLGMAAARAKDPRVFFPAFDILAEKPEVLVVATYSITPFERRKAFVDAAIAARKDFAKTLLEIVKADTFARVGL